MEKLTLNLWTSYVTPELLNRYIESEVLPIFIARNIINSSLIGGWHGTAVHFPDLAPSPELLRSWKYQGLPGETFERDYFLGLGRININKVLSKIKLMTDLCHAKGAVLLGYGKDPSQDHRWYLGKYINTLGILESLVTEFPL